MPVERETVRVATRAQSPTLAAYALALLDAGFGPADVPYVRAALDSPYPQVRSAAIDLSKWFETEALRAPTQRAREALADGYSGSKSSPTGPGPRSHRRSPRRPALSGREVQLPRRQPRSPGLPLSADDPQKVTAFLAKGKPTFTAAEMTAAVDQRMAAEQAAHDAAAEPAADDMASAMAQAAELMAAMNSGEDPMKALQEMSEAKQAASHDWTAEITRLEGIDTPRFVVVEEKNGVPTRVVAVFDDPAVGATAIAYLKPPGRGNEAMNELATDPDAMTRWQRWQEILGP